MQIKKMTQKGADGSSISYEFNVPPMKEIPKPVDTGHPGAPKGTDTVPAWLTPGEYVMNAEATRMFKPQIEAMNNHGKAIQRMQGGTVPDYKACGGKVMYKNQGGEVSFFDNLINMITEDAKKERPREVEGRIDRSTLREPEGIPEYYGRSLDLPPDSPMSPEYQRRSKDPSYWVDDTLLDQLAFVESTNNPKAVSPAGAQGMYQWMPHAAKDPGYGVKGGFDPFDPVASRQASMQYLRGLQKAHPDWSPEEILQAYNWGIGNMKKYKAGQIKEMPIETADYAKKFSPVLYREAGGSVPYKDIAIEPTMQRLIELRSTLSDPEAIATVDSQMRALAESNAPIPTPAIMDSYVTSEVPEMGVGPYGVPVYEQPDPTKAIGDSLYQPVADKMEMIRQAQQVIDDPSYDEESKRRAMEILNMPVQPKGMAQPEYINSEEPTDAGSPYGKGMYEQPVPKEPITEMGSLRGLLSSTQGIPNQEGAFNPPIPEEPSMEGTAGMSSEDWQRYGEMAVSGDLDTAGGLNTPTNPDGTIPPYQTDKEKGQAELDKFIEENQDRLSNDFWGTTDISSDKVTQAQEIVDQAEANEPEEGRPDMTPEQIKDTFNAGKKVATENPSMLEKIGGWLKNTLGDLWNEDELTRMAVLYLGQRALGYSHIGSLRFSAKSYVTRVDAIAKANAAAKKDWADKAFELTSEAKYTPESIKMFEQTGDKSVLKLIDEGTDLSDIKTDIMVKSTIGNEAPQIVEVYRDKTGQTRDIKTGQIIDTTGFTRYAGELHDTGEIQKNALSYLNKTYENGNVISISQKGDDGTTSTRIQKVNTGALVSSYASRLRKLYGPRADIFLNSPEGSQRLMAYTEAASNYYDRNKEPVKNFGGLMAAVDSGLYNINVGKLTPEGKLVSADAYDTLNKTLNAVVATNNNNNPKNPITTGQVAKQALQIITADLDDLNPQDVKFVEWFNKQKIPAGYSKELYFVEQYWTKRLNQNQ